MFIKMFNHNQYLWTWGVLIQSAQYVCMSLGLLGMLWFDLTSRFIGLRDLTLLWWPFASPSPSDHKL